MLRIDINILWTIIDLLILYVLLKKFLFKPVHNILAQRKADVDAQMQKAAQTNAQAQELKAQYEESIRTIDAENARKVADAQAKAGQEYDRIIADANKKSEGIVAAARDRAKLAAEEERQLAEADIADMLKDAARKQAEGEDDHALYDQFLNEAGKIPTGKDV